MGRAKTLTTGIIAKIWHTCTHTDTHTCWPPARSPFTEMIWQPFLLPRATSELVSVLDYHHNLGCAHTHPHSHARKLSPAHIQVYSFTLHTIMYAHTNTLIHIQIRLYTNTLIHIHTHIHTHAHVHIHTHMYTHVHTHLAQRDIQSVWVQRMLVVGGHCTQEL